MTQVRSVKSYTAVVATDQGASAFEDAELHLTRQEITDGLAPMVVAALGEARARRFGPGELVLAADTSGHGHVTRLVGGGPVEALSIPVNKSPIAGG